MTKTLYIIMKLNIIHVLLDLIKLDNTNIWYFIQI